MMYFWNRIAIWSSLHEPVLIFGSSYGSVFQFPINPVHNEYISGSPVTGPDCCNMPPNTQGHVYTYAVRMTHTLYRHMHTIQHTHIQIHTRIYYIYICKSVNKESAESDTTRPSRIRLGPLRFDSGPRVKLGSPSRPGSVPTRTRSGSTRRP